MDRWFRAAPILAQRVSHALFPRPPSGGSPEGFAPPAPFTLSELDPSGILTERVYTKEELARYLTYGRQKCQAAIEALTDEAAERRCVFRMA